MGTMVISGDRGSGKTTFGLTTLIERARSNPSTHYAHVSDTIFSAEYAHKKARDMISKLVPFGVTYKQSKVSLPNGSTISFMNSKTTIEGGGMHGRILHSAVYDCITNNSTQAEKVVHVMKPAVKENLFIIDN